MTIPTDIAEPNIGSAYVELFVLDLTGIGGSTYYVTPHYDEGGGALEWKGETYTTLPITSAGWEVQSDGAQPKPTITLALLNNTTLLAAIKSLGDLIGGKVTRYRTFHKYLDGQDDADPDVHFPPDVYLIEQKTSHTNETVTWSLSSIIDRFGMKLPRRQILRDGDSRNPGFPGVSRFRRY